MSKIYRLALGAVMMTLTLGLVACTSPKQNPGNTMGLAESAYTTGSSGYHGTKVKYPNINFSFNSAVIHPSWYAELDNVALAVKSHPRAMVKLYGFTDDTGSQAYNLKLSKRRAASVAKYLMSKGVPASQIKMRGFGKIHPIADNGKTVGEHLNRRVEITVKPMK